MGRLTKDALLGASDLRQEEIDLPTIGGSVVVQGLSAAFSNQAQSEALEMKTIGHTQTATVNTVALEEIQLLHGLKDPKLNSREEARQFMERCGPAAKAIITGIDKLSGVDKEAIEEASARFQGGGAEPPREGKAGSNGSPSGSDRPAVPARTGA